MSDFITHFGIDWKLLLAQIVNFGVLLFLLKRFVYGPILTILKTRKEKIEQGLQYARDAEEELKHTEILRQEILESAKREAHAIVARAESSAQQREAELLEVTHKKTEIAIAEARRIIQDEKVKMQNEFQGEAEALVRAGIIKVLGELPAEVRDASLVADAVRELKSLSPEKTKRP
ncbi:MAG: F0F1 ATP synthase subunit B [Patescibacteria group bacterium]|nr:F0F1 ATP synthase subunit B [Patescibacteria group bacterium]MDE2437914.1 F0F1 ATP synthase subunit B [Patescibacteria group bacterium]